MQYNKVKDEFVVIPKKDLLRVEGYLPTINDDEENGGSIENSLEGEGGENGNAEDTGIEMK